MMTLEVFAARRPDVPIHIYGHKMGALPFAFRDHGQVTPDQLNDIYNLCYAGLSLSFTNVSLVALEMLAAGCIPIVNDSQHIRTDVDNPFIRYVVPHPHALAAALDEMTTMADFDSLSRVAAASVRAGSWNDAGARVDEIFRRVLSRSDGTREVTPVDAAIGTPAATMNDVVTDAR
jgi:hypothetical protein